jgi:hypothetical protein
MGNSTFNPKPKVSMNANEVKFALHKMFPSPDWLAVEELFVPGFNRYIDFWAMRIKFDIAITSAKKYPLGKYMATHAIEIKVSKADFKSEMDTPAKKIGAQTFSNYFSFAAPRGVIDLDDIPKGIGYIEFSGSKGKFLRKPEYTYVSNPGWDFIASLGRSLSRG